jgi:hypothetical protein
MGLSVMLGIFEGLAFIADPVDKMKDNLCIADSSAVS